MRNIYNMATLEKITEKVHYIELAKDGKILLE
jgi:hypothetical protein